MELMLDTTVVSIDAASHLVNTSRGVVDYNRLLIATGGPARSFRATERFVIPGADLANIHVLRESTDAASIQGLLNDGVSVAALGM